MVDLNIHKQTLGNVQKKLVKSSEKFTLGFLVGSRTRDRVNIKDLIIPRQKRGLGYTVVSDKQVARSLMKMMASSQQCVGIAICQQNFPVFISNINNYMMEKMAKLDNQPMALLVCNEKPKDVLWKVFHAK